MLLPASSLQGSGNPDGRGRRPNQVLSTLPPSTRAAFRHFITGFATAVDGQGQALNNDLGTADPATGGLDTLTNILDDSRSQLATLIARSGDVLSTIGRQQGAVRQAVRSGESVLASAASVSAPISATVQALPSFLSQLQRTSSVLSGVSGDLSAAVTALRPATPLLGPALAALHAAAPNFTAVFRALPGVMQAGRQGLPAISEILAVARPSLSAIYVAMRQLIPVVQLVAADAPTLVGSIANPGQALNGTMVVSSSGRVVHYASGLPTFWNEAIGGWVKRLPSNRQNPYPEPQSGLNIGHGGLKAYDCRNLGNPDYLPPFGSTPPCLLQGPWMFDGKSAYYPRLQEAPPSPSS